MIAQNNECNEYQSANNLYEQCQKESRHIKASHDGFR